MVLYGNSLYVFGGQNGAERFGELYKCSILKNFKWKLIKAYGESQPLDRLGHSAVVIDHQMIIFGGWNGEDTMDDLYHYSFGNIFSSFESLYSLKYLV
jgi:hypothetical protein